ncbi:MAG: hypothetical protein JXA20_03410 [Spirochaetes bacterium]|nr:hypothetical protein [Spirochaetota bacterium]
MNEFFIVKSFFIFLALWGIGVVLLWFRPRIEIFWKIIATLIFLFYLWFFFDEIRSGVAQFTDQWAAFSVHFLKELTVLVFVNLFFIWPLSLILIFYKADDIGAERLLKFICLLTLVLWIVFIIYFFANRGAETQLIEGIRKIFPHGN